MSRLEHGRRVIDQMIDTLGAGSKDIDCVNHVIDQAQKATELQAKVDELEKELNQAIKRCINVALENVRYQRALEYAQSELEYAHVTGNMELRSRLIKDSIEAIDKALKGVKEWE